MPDDVVIQKLTSIDRCLRAIRDYLGGDLSKLQEPIVLDAVVLNLQRACERRRMVGFRNVAIHEYRKLDPTVVRTVVEHRLGDFVALCRELSTSS